MAKKNIAATNAKTLYSVCGCNGDIPFSFEQLFPTPDDAAKVVADEVNKRFKAHRMNCRVSVESCRDGFMQLISPNIVWTYKIIAHKCP